MLSKLSFYTIYKFSDSICRVHLYAIFLIAFTSTFI